MLKMRMHKLLKQPVRGLDETPSTGADVAALYLSQAGKEKTLPAFFTMDRVPAEPLDRPYELNTVPRGLRSHAEHYIMSLHGIARINKGVVSEYSTLQEWDNHRRCFDRLQSISFFRDFIRRRALKRWQKAVRQRSYARLRRKVAARAFLAKPAFLACLQRTATAACRMQEAELLSLGAEGKVVEVDEWEDAQVAAREQVARAMLDSCIEACRLDLEGVCREAGKQAHDWAASVRSMAELADHTGYEPRSGHNRSLVAIIAEKRERKRSFFQKMEEAGLMGNLVRLSDYMLTNALAQHAIDTSVALLSSLQPNGLNRGSCFNVRVSFSDEEAGLRFKPDEFRVTEALVINAVQGAVALLGSLHRLSHTRSFIPFYEGKPSSTRLHEVVRASAPFQQACNGIERAVSKAFSAARSHAESLEEHCPLHEFAASWSPEEYAAQKRTFLELRSDLEQQTRWRTGLDGVSASTHIGFLHIDAVPPTESLLPVTQQATEQMKAKLLALLHVSSEVCLSSLKAGTAAVQAGAARPGDISGCTAVYRKQEAALEDLQRAAREIAEMHEVLIVHKQRIPTVDTVLHDDIKEALEAYASALVSALQQVPK